MRVSEYEVIDQLEKDHWWYKGLRKIVRTILTDKHPLTVKQTILDAGCGTGGNSYFLSEYGSVTGIDISEEAYSLCQDKSYVETIIGDVNNLPFEDARYDIIFCLDVLYHSDVSGRVALAEMNRVLKPGGTIIINVPTYQWLKSTHDKAISTKTRYSRRRIETLLKQAGFTIQKSSHWNVIFLPLIVIYRLLKKFCSGKTSASDLFYLPSVVNDFFYKVIEIEDFLIKRISLPIGLSIILKAVKEIRRS